MTDDIAEQYSMMCMAHSCTASDCGASEKFNLCNETNMICANQFFKCQKERVDPSEDTYVKKTQKG